MVEQCHECFGIFRRSPGQVFLFEHLCPECEFKRTVLAHYGELVDEPLPAIPVSHGWLDRVKMWASRWAAYLDAMLLRLL